MNFEIKEVKMIVMVPIDYVDVIRKAVCEVGAGIIGNYSYCTSSTNSVGTFISNDDADPFVGNKNQIEFVEEEKLEFKCKISIVKKVLEKIREVHPYEEPGIDIVPLIDESNFD